KIDAGLSHLHQYLARPGSGRGEIAVTHGVDPAGLFDINGFHRILILRLRCTVAAYSNRYASVSGKITSRASEGTAAAPLIPSRCVTNFLSWRRWARSSQK